MQTTARSHSSERMAAQVPGWAIAGFLCVVAALALLFADAWLLTQQPFTMTAALDGRAAAFSITQAHDPEYDGGTLYRWTTGHTLLHFDNTSWNAPQQLELRLGAAPPGLNPAVLHVLSGESNIGEVTLAAQPCRARLLVPSQAWWNPQVVVELGSATTQVLPDTRMIGARLEGATLATLDRGVRWPSPALFLAQSAIVAAALVVGIRTRRTWRQTACGGFLVIGALIVIVGWQPFVAATYTIRLAIAAIGLTAATIVILPALEHHAAGLSGFDGRFVQSIWLITLGAILIRLAGALFPLYSAHDLPLNVERLERTIAGTLISTNRSFEFRSGVTIYPPGPYLALLPAFLSGISPRLLVQGGNSIVDGLCALSTALLAGRVGANRRTSQFAAVAYAALPVMLTSLYWGHSAQIFGQAFMAPLALVLLEALERPRMPLWAAASALLAMAFLSHIGVTVIAIGWLGLFWLLARIRSATPLRIWWRMTLAFAAAGLIGLVFVYGPALAFKAEQTAEVGERVLREGYASQILIGRAALISFYQYGWPLALAGMALLPRTWRHSRPARDILLAWIAAALVFCGIELVTGLQARYFVFLAPIACLGIALSLDWLARRGRIWTLAAWAIALFLVVQGSAAWYNAVFNDIQMSMVPLLR